LLQNNTLLAELPGLMTAKPSKVVKRLEKTLPVVLYTLHLMSPDEKVKQILELYQIKWRSIKPISNGETLKEMGLSPGPVYQKILFRLRAGWLDGEIHSKEEEIEYLRKLLSESK